MSSLKKLIDVKSIITILLTLVVVYQAVIGKTDIHDIYLMIVSFYFGTQLVKNSTAKDGETK